MHGTDGMHGTHGTHDTQCIGASGTTGHDAVAQVGHDVVAQAGHDAIAQVVQDRDLVEEILRRVYWRSVPSCGKVSSVWRQVAKQWTLTAVPWTRRQVETANGCGTFAFFDYLADAAHDADGANKAADDEGASADPDAPWTMPKVNSIYDPDYAEIRWTRTYAQNVDNTGPRPTPSSLEILTHIRSTHWSFDDHSDSYGNCEYAGIFQLSGLEETNALWLFVDAGHGYTGFECCGHISMTLSYDLWDLVVFGMSKSERQLVVEEATLRWETKQ